MTDHPSGAPERRRHPRIAPKGSIVLLPTTGIDPALGRIANLSEGGVYALTSGTAPSHLLGRGVELEVRVDAGRAEWMKIAGRVLRIDPTGIALSFDEAPAALVRLVDELATASRAHDRVMSVVLIDTDLQRRAALAAGFRTAGCAVVEASTPLEAIVRLGESSFEPDIIAVADSYPATAAEDMREFVERDHPNTTLVRIGDELLQPDGFAHWLSSSDPLADLPSRVREVLVAPRRAR